MVHGIGLCDEWPAIRYPTMEVKEQVFLKKNMTITVESYIGKVGGKEGVKLEQQYLVGENGLELMSHHPLEDINEDNFSNGITRCRQNYISK
jgi:Xaa-Pro aminopeptidase